MLLLLASFLLCFGSSCEGTPQAGGVVGTGNTCRIRGKVALAEHGVSREIVLLRRDGSAFVPKDTIWSDSVSGTFEFTTAPDGVYRVEAWLGSHLLGSSGEFPVDGDVSGILIVLIEPIVLHLDLARLGDVDSVFVDYPDNPGVRDQSLWRIQLLRDSGSILHVRARTAGRESWHQLLVAVKDGTPTFLDLSDAKAVEFVRAIDTAAYRIDRHTVALWTFDGLDDHGRIPDSGPLHLDLVPQGDPVFSTSPQGMALDVSSGGAVASDSVLCRKLVDSPSGQTTIQIRMLQDSASLEGFVVEGRSRVRWSPFPANAPS